METSSLDQFTAPEADLAGGYYAVGLDDVGDGYADLMIYAASDNGEIDHEYSTSSGASVHAFFAAAPASSTGSPSPASRRPTIPSSTR